MLDFFMNETIPVRRFINLLICVENVSFTFLANTNENDTLLKFEINSTSDKKKTIENGTELGVQFSLH